MPLRVCFLVRLDLAVGGAGWEVKVFLRNKGVSGSIRNGAMRGKKKKQKKKPGPGGLSRRKNPGAEISVGPYFECFTGAQLIAAVWFWAAGQGDREKPQQPRTRRDSD